MNKNTRQYCSYYKTENISIDDKTNNNGCFYIGRYYGYKNRSFDELELTSKEMKILYGILKDIYKEESNEWVTR